MTRTPAMQALLDRCLNDIRTLERTDLVATTPPTIYYAEVETSHFTFRAAGATEAQARQALMAAWRSHVHRTRRQGGYIDPDYVNIDDANVLEMPLGQGFLDWEPSGKAVRDG